MVDVRRCSIAEYEAALNWQQVLDVYAAEAATPEIGPIAPEMDIYRAGEAAHLFHPVGAFDGGLLVGFIMPVVVTLPHYGVLAATVESFFVLPSYRKRGFGLQLLACAEDVARSLGAKALLLSAPADGALSRVMRLHRSYRCNSETFVKALV